MNPLTNSLFIQLPVLELLWDSHATATPSTASRPALFLTTAAWVIIVTATAEPMQLFSSSRPAAWMTCTKWRQGTGGGTGRGTDTAAGTPTPPAGTRRVKRARCVDGGVWCWMSLYCLSSLVTVMCDVLSSPLRLRPPCACCGSPC